VLRLVGQSLVRLGRPEEAEPFLREGLDLARQLGMYRVAGGLLLAIAFARSVTGDLNESRAYASEALATLRAIGDEYNAANALAHLAETEFRGGNVGIAGRLAEESLKVYRKLGRLNVNVLNNLAAYFVAMERYDEAYAQARETVELARERQQRVTVAISLQHLAAIVVLRESENVEPSRSKAARGARVLGFTDAQVNALGAPPSIHGAAGVRAGDDRFAKGVRPRRTRDAPLDGRIDDGRSGDRRSAYGITMFPATPPIPNHYRRRAVVYRYMS
jgi:tetratricopeptide (TPR) repeat protein